MDLHVQHSTSQALLSYKALSGSPETRTASSSAWDQAAGVPPTLKGHALISTGLFTSPAARQPLVLMPTSVHPPSRGRLPPTKRQARTPPAHKGLLTSLTLPPGLPFYRPLPLRPIQPWLGSCCKSSSSLTSPVKEP